MIVPWMLYALLVALLLAAGAGPLERALRLAGRAGRWAWVGALAGAVLVPLLSLTVTRGPVEAVPGTLGPVSPVAVPVSVALGSVSQGLEVAASPLLGSLEGPIVRIWALASTLLLGLLLASAIRLSRVRRGWTEQLVEGEPVLVSRDVGPAVLGLFRPRIVLPRWVVERGAEARRLIMAHEREHCRARDPLTVVLCALPAVLMPWNLPVWWCLRRLRLAVELDCDDRVLRAASRGTRLRYGRLLVEVGRRPSGPLPAVAAFSERRTVLERRLRALTDRPPRDRIRKLAAWSLVGVLAVLAACVVPSPDDAESSLEPEVHVSAVEPPTFTPFTVSPRLRNVEEVRAAMVLEYPPPLREAGRGGSVDLWLHVGEDGRVLRSRIHRTSGSPALDEAALRVGRMMEFSPARDGDRVVATWISLPLRFDVRSAAPEAGPSGSATEPSSIRIPPEPGEPDPPSPVRLEEDAVRRLPPPPEERRDLRERPVFTPYTVAPSVVNRDEVQRALIREYPPLLRDAGIGGTANVWFFIDESGRVRDTRVHTSSGHDTLDEAALRVARTIRFSPAKNRDREVPVWISLPIRFEVR